MSWARQPLVRYVARRCVQGVVALLVISFLIFMGTQVLPGNAAKVALGRGASQDAVKRLGHELNLDKPVLEQYADWFRSVLHGDLGQSAVGVATGTSRPVSEVIGGPLANSLILAAVTVLLMIPLGLVLGVISGLRANRPLDHAISVSTLGAVSLPEFVTGSVLIALFGITFKWLPATSTISPEATPLDSPDILVLPVLTLLAVTLAHIVRMVRASVIEVFGSDYVRTAQLAGLSQARIVWSYVLPNALAPSIQVITLNAQYLVGGIIIVEAVFSYPGLGAALVDAVGARDIPTVQAISLLIASFYIALNLVADILVTLVTPRLRSAPA